MEVTVSSHKILFLTEEEAKEVELQVRDYKSYFIEDVSILLECIKSFFTNYGTSIEITSYGGKSYRIECLKGERWVSIEMYINGDKIFLEKEYSGENDTPIIRIKREGNIFPIEALVEDLIPIVETYTKNEKSIVTVKLTNTKSGILSMKC